MGFVRIILEHGKWVILMEKMDMKYPLDVNNITIEGRSAQENAMFYSPKKILWPIKFT